MNRNLSKAIFATVAALSAAQTAWAQYDPYCYVNNGGPSTDYAVYSASDLLFQTTVGLSGTVTYNTNNAYGQPNCGNEVLTQAGRFGFAIGSTGSLQTTADDFLNLTWGMPLAVGDSCGFGMIVTGADPTFTETLFGGGGISYATYGASDRYFIVGNDVGNVRVRLRVDLVADTARYSWNLQNIDTKTDPIGLMVGSWVKIGSDSSTPLDPSTDLTYVYTPGYKPFITEQAFRQTDSSTPFPNTMMFAISQQEAYGLQVVNSPLSGQGVEGINVPDQTQVDDFVIGQYWEVLNPFAGPFTNPPKPPYPYDIGTDVPFIKVNANQFPSGVIPPGTDLFMNRASFLQFWRPQPIAPGNSRVINSYYRSTWGVSDYAAPFAAVIDTPKAITTDPTNPNTYTNGTFTFGVYVDNALAYDLANTGFDLHNLKITVNLPQGFVDASNPTGPNSSTLTATLPFVKKGDMASQTFSVQVNSTATPGPQHYQVTIQSDTGAVKVLYGTINVASQPNLTIRQSANLVGVPWVFSTSDWGTVLGLTPNIDFQAFEWSSNLGEYILSPNASRGKGVFIVSAADHGAISLGGSPTEPANTVPTIDPNTQGSDPTDRVSDIAVELNPGWNLIANPFNYAISLGDLQGLDKSNSNLPPLSFSQMVGANLIAPGLAYFNQDSQGYSYISATTDLMAPNTGYWIFVSSPGKVQLQFPFVMSPFTRAVPQAAWKQSENQWKLQLSALNGKSTDAQNYVGVGSAALAKTMNSRKPPMAPIKNAVELAIQDTVSGKTVARSQSMRSTGGNTQTWNMQVTSKAGGSVTVTWPNVKTVPSDVQFRLTDSVTGAVRDLRRDSGYTFTATPGMVRAFTVQAVPGASARPAIANVSVTHNRGSSSVNVSYVLTGNATVSVRVLANGRKIYDSVVARADHAGANSATWNLRDSANRQVAPGLYMIDVIAEGPDGQQVHRTVPITVTR